MADQQPHTPTTQYVRNAYIDHRRNMAFYQDEYPPPIIERYAEFDRWLAAIEAAAEQRGAIKALRRVAKDLEWLGAQGNIPTPDTSWQGVLECIRIINSEALTIEYRADRLEGDE